VELAVQPRQHAVGLAAARPAVDLAAADTVVAVADTGEPRSY
jgi:hypothetical protein